MWWRVPEPGTVLPTYRTRVEVLAPVTSRQEAWRATKRVLFVKALTIQVGSTSWKRSGGKGTFFSMGVLGSKAMGILPKRPSLVELRAPVAAWAKHQ